MIRDLLRWVAPGVVTVVVGTVAALAMSSPSMVEHLSMSGQKSLADAGLSWAHVRFDGRHAALAGTATTHDQRTAALTHLASLTGVSSVSDQVTLAPIASPYVFEAIVENSSIRLLGSVPHEATRQQLLSLPRVNAEALTINSGQPDEDRWQAGVDFALAQAARVHNGRFVLTDLMLSMSGDAISPRALGQLQMASAEPPAGISLGEANFTPMRATPYLWTASFDGDRISVTGNVPEETLVERYRLADLSGVPVATGVSLASGAPEGFADLSRILLEQLSQLEHGEASIIDGVSRISGTPPNFEVAQAVIEALSGAGSIVELSPPTVSDYWLSVSLQETGVLVFDGYAPDERTRSAFAAIKNADISYLKLGQGAPATYRTAADFGLDVLPHLSEGRFTVRDNLVTLSGIAASSSDFLALRVAIATIVPEGLEVNASDLRAPRASQYRFAAAKQANGNVILSGMVPNPDVETALLNAAGARASSALSYASGEPTNFEASALKAIKFMPLMASGEASFDGTSWTVSGAAATAINRAAINTEFAVQSLAQAGWALDVSETLAGPVTVNPYLWSAERLADGSFLFEGNVPADALRAYLAVKAGARVTDNTQVSLGAPDDFVGTVRAAMDALLLLDEGRVAFDGDDWTIAGVASNNAARESSLGILSAAIGADVSSDIAAADPVPAGPYLWSASKSVDGGVRVTGAVPAETVQRFMAVRVGSKLQDETLINPGAPEGFIDNALRALDILALLSEGEASFDGTVWTVTGEGRAADANIAAATILGDSAEEWTLTIAAPAGVARAAEPEIPAASTEESAAETAPTDASASQVPAVDAAQTALTEQSEELAPPPAAEPQTSAPVETTLQPEAETPPKAPASQPEIAAAPPVAPAPPPVPSKPAAICRDTVDALSAQNAILFQSGAALIAAGAAPVLDAFAEALETCSDAIVHVEGHTDADGDDKLNLALSVARAEAVVDELIARGLSPDRVYAIGYGEAVPVADNNTAAGKRQNRRIVISVLDEHQ